MAVKSPFTIYDLRFTICRKSGGGTGVAPVVSGVASETRPRNKAALYLESPVAAGHQSSILNPQFRRAFTLIELLVVISILGILAALTVPALKNLGKSNAATSASSQLLQAVGRARQLAMENRTTVYMIFVPANFWLSPYTSGPNWTNGLTPAQLSAAVNLCDKQLTGFAFVANGAVGDQPGRHTWHYLESWQSLPDGSFIAAWKFAPFDPLPAMVIADPVSGQAFNVYGFATQAVPFPTADAPVAFLPCIEFNYLGQLTTDGQNPASQHEYIPLARGSVAPAMDASKVLQFGSPAVSESPPGNSTSSAYNIVDIDWLTGRAALRFQKVQ